MSDEELIEQYLRKWPVRYLDQSSVTVDNRRTPREQRLTELLIARDWAENGRPR